MPKIKKSNRVLEVSQSQLKGYLMRGYDEINEQGEIIQYATGGRNVSLGEYNKVIKELKEAKSTIEGMQKDIKVLEEENERLDKLAKRMQGQNGQQSRAHGK